MQQKNKRITIRSSAAEYLTFIAATGDDKNAVEVRYEDENIWITQKMLATLYEVDVRTINYHILKIFEDSELSEDSVIRNFRITATDGKAYNTKHYNLQMIIAVGFKVNSDRAVQFRKWVNAIAKDYTIKGWVMDSERMKNDGSILTKNILKNCFQKFVKLECPSVSSIKKLLIYTQQVSIMTKLPKPQRIFLQMCKINCIGQFTNILLQNLLWSVQILKNQTWG